MRRYRGSEPGARATGQVAGATALWIGAANGVLHKSLNARADGVMMNNVDGRCKVRPAVAGLARSLALGVLIALAAPPSSIHAAETTAPEVERSAFILDPNIEVNCFASEPDVINPIAMQFDTRGRLWVVTSEAYPHVDPDHDPNDKLIILEDTDGDGRADKRTVFADGLLVPTGFAIGDGGAYVANQPDLLFFKDTDGDGKADVRRVVLSGFGTEDNHHAIHAWRWGPDGGIYFQSGIFLHSQVETPYGPIRMVNGGIFRLEPRSMRLSIYSRCDQYANPWGHAFDRWGQDFLTEAPGGHIFPLAHGIAKGDAPTPYPIIEGAPKSCGIEFISGRHWPDDWQGDMVLNAFKNKVVHRYRFSDDGSGFTAKELAPPLIVSKEENFRPVDVKMGPDGAIYIADWYNPIIGHMQYNFRDPRRDKTHGRIWRITYKGRPLVPKPSIAGQPIEKLLELLKSPEDYTRYEARRELYEQYVNFSVGPKDRNPGAGNLASWLQKLDPKDPEFEHQRLEALWTYQTIDVVEPNLLKTLLRSPDYRVRAAATRAMHFWMDRLENPLELLAIQAIDEHPRVRLEALTALSFLSSAQAAEVATMVLDRTMDRFIEYALAITIKALKPYWLPALERGDFAFNGNQEHLGFALKAAGSQEVIPRALALVKEGKTPEALRDELVLFLAAEGGPDELAYVCKRWLVTDSPGRTSRVLAQLRRSARERKVLPAGDTYFLQSYMVAPDEATAIEAIGLAGDWKVEALRKDLEHTATESRSPSRTRAAYEALSQLGGSASVEFLTKQCGQATAQSRVLAACAIAPLKLPTAIETAARIFAKNDTSLNYEIIGRLVRAIIERKQGAAQLAAALSKEVPAADMAKLALRALFAAGSSEDQLASLFTKAAGLANERPALTAQRVAELVEQVKAKGDPARGESVFRREDVGCFKCHAINGAGGQVGPDLRGLGAGSPMDYIVEAVLVPNKAVREGYAAVIAETKDGEVHSGIKVRQTREELILRDSEHDELRIPMSEVASQRDSGSLMPNGLADLLTEQEFIDLVRFISELGKPGPYATANVPLVRRWRQVADLPTGEGQGSSSQAAWAPIYSKADGMLPLSELHQKTSGGKLLVQAEVEVTTPGEIGLRIISPTGTTLKIHDREFSKLEDIRVHLPSGIQKLTFSIDSEQKTGELRCEIVEVAGSPGRARPVAGR